MDEKKIKGVMQTPEIILCRDPPTDNKNNDILDGVMCLWNSELGSNPDVLMEPNVSKKKLDTFFKVTPD